MGTKSGVLLIIGGGIAAYKSLELIRRLREAGVSVRVVLTDAAKQFVTPLSVASLAGTPLANDMFDPQAEADFGHIELSRANELILVAPATADLIAKMAAGFGSDLASTVLLATDKPVIIAPAMNVRMWEHPATQRNIATLQRDGVTVVGPDEGEMACGEYGYGRMAEPEVLLATVQERLGGAGSGAQPLSGRRAVVTAGPTWEPIDPVRFIGNCSSGKQGVAIADALAQAGADVVLVAGPGTPSPAGVCTVQRVQTAVDMEQAVREALPADVFVGVAAVADWRPEVVAEQKLKKADSDAPPQIKLVENPDILHGVAARDGRDRPGLVIGFAAETGDLLSAASAKLRAKGCDWIVANAVTSCSGVLGGDENEVTLITAAGADSWPRMSKRNVATRLVERIAATLGEAK